MKIECECVEHKECEDCPYLEVVTDVKKLYQLNSCTVFVTVRCQYYEICKRIVELYGEGEDV